MVGPASWLGRAAQANASPHTYQKAPRAWSSFSKLAVSVVFLSAFLLPLQFAQTGRFGTLPSLKPLLSSNFELTSALALSDEQPDNELPINVTDFVQVLHASLSEGRKSLIPGSVLDKNKDQPYACEAVANHRVGIPSSQFDISICIYEASCFDGFIRIARQNKTKCHDRDAIFRCAYGSQCHVGAHSALATRDGEGLPNVN